MGLVIGTLLAAFLYFFLSWSFVDAFMVAGDFLFRWYVITLILSIFFVFLITGRLPIKYPDFITLTREDSLINSAEAKEYTRERFPLMLVAVLACSSLAITGSYLLSVAVRFPEIEWNIPRLVFGTLFLYFSQKYNQIKMTSPSKPKKTKEDRAWEVLRLLDIIIKTGKKI